MFQDVVALLFLALVPVFGDDSAVVWYWALPLTLSKTALLFITLVAFSRWLLPLDELNLHRMDVDIETIWRDGTNLELTKELHLMPDDTVPLKGTVPALEQAEACLLAGLG